MTQEWQREIFIPAMWDARAGLIWLSMNDRMHWAQRAKITKSYRSGARAIARMEKLPIGLKHVHITAHVHKTTRRAYDAHNLLPTLKAIIDGLVDYGLIPDDSNKHLTGPDIRQGGHRRDRPGITLTITAA